MKELGIYIHIPFCKQKCSYCDFISYQEKENLVEKYIEAIKKEISNINIDSNQYEITTIYIGGGTPSFINANFIKDILNEVYKKFNINKAEITLEVNPGTVNKEKLQEYYNTGINRLSIGLQSTNDKLLKIIGRIHNYKEFLDAYNNAISVGFKNINVDLMIGLPTQTIADVEESLDKIINLNPSHISVYSLILEEGTILNKKIEAKELFLPSEEIERRMYWEVKKNLETAEFTHYEISNFAKKGYESKHNINCWEQKEYLGFGAAAHSYFNKTRYSNPETIEKYIEEINNDDIKKIIHENQNKEDQMKEYMLLGLRKMEGIRISKFKEKFVDNPIYKYMEELNKLVEEELIEIDKDNIKLTNKGIDLANLVWEEFV